MTSVTTGTPDPAPETPQPAPGPPSAQPPDPWRPPSTPTAAAPAMTYPTAPTPGGQTRSWTSASEPAQPLSPEGPREAVPDVAAMEPWPWQIPAAPAGSPPGKRRTAQRGRAGGTRAAVVLLVQLAAVAGVAGGVLPPPRLT